ncbi:DUF4861 family protein [Dysgonomonadaceae bacterium zrk40]|nr:DUF4861 family protein [Dysgonomonadaceae bacterium zrk40]
MLAILIGGCTTQKSEVTLRVQNSGTGDRENQMVEISWGDLKKKLGTVAEKSLILVDDEGKQHPWQIVTNDTDSKSIIFPVTLKAGGTQTFRITEGEPNSFEPLVYGRLVPERKDDFTWENNRTAFRVYGPALKATGEISNGMDFWAKRTESLIIDKWYRDDLAGVASYHEDHGEGLDFYKVGRTLGLGMTAPIHSDTLCLGDNFVTAEIINNGPLRLTFRLTYEPYAVDEKMVTETRIISLDAYSLFNKVTHIFETDLESLNVATGIVTDESVVPVTFGDSGGIIAYETPGNEANGTIYTAVIQPAGYESVQLFDGHYAGLNSITPGSSYTSYVGGGWSKAGFDNFAQWVSFLKTEKAQIDQPLTIEIQ